MTDDSTSWSMLFYSVLLTSGFVYVFGEGLRRLHRKAEARSAHPLFRLLALPMGIALWGTCALLVVQNLHMQHVGFELWPEIPMSVSAMVLAAYLQQILMTETRRKPMQILFISIASSWSLMAGIYFLLNSMQWQPEPQFVIVDWVLAWMLASGGFFWFATNLSKRIAYVRPAASFPPPANSRSYYWRLGKKIAIASAQGGMIGLATMGAWHGVKLSAKASSVAPYYANLSVGSMVIAAGVISLLVIMLVTGLVIDALELHTRKLANDLLEQTAILSSSRERDLLTTLPNRLAAERHIAEIIDHMQRRRELFAVFYIGIDNFRSVNESLGFETGDHVLTLTAERIRQVVAEQDFIARMGGDEFVIIAPSCGAPALAVNIGAQIVESLARYYDLPGGQVPLSASVGIAIFPNDGHSAADLLSHANLAMSEAKKSGRNQYCFFSEKMAEIVKRDFAIQAEMRTALTNQDFILYLQPQFDLSDRSLSGCEALVRWRLADGSIRFPDQFIPVAERSGLIIPLGNQVLDQACDMVRRWLDQYGGAVRMGVNVSAVQFQQTDFIDTVQSALDRSGIPPQFLQIELTESTVMRDAEISLARFEALREMGVQVAIDDFGTGYSSLAYLKKFVCQHLKIDRSFVRDITHDAGDRHIVKAVIDLAHNFGLQTVAEGVETIEHQNLLVELGCNETQGYYYSKPIPEAEFVKLFLLNGLTSTKIHSTVAA